MPKWLNMTIRADMPKRERGMTRMMLQEPGRFSEGVFENMVEK
jgi:hypothetical protein